jgi:glycosyltransferase involved in cell wall biosynthesis
MRIVIDFLDGPDAVPSAALGLAHELARDLARQPGGAELWIAAPASLPGATDSLRLAFAGLLPRSRIRPFALPADPVLRAPLRRHALATLAPDVVLAMPGTDADALPPALPTVRMEPGTEDGAGLWRRLQATAAERSGRTRPAAHGARPRLALVSPLPPQRSGIADYSAALVPELARYYDVELIVDQEADDPRLAGLPRRPPQWLREQDGYYQRVLYHFGNSAAHTHMFDLLREVPGVVVLHDFFFGNILHHLEHQPELAHGYLAQGFLRALYESHGHTGLLGLRREGRKGAVWKFPANKVVLDNASGVIVHAEYQKGLAVQWYGEGAADHWRTIPLMRSRPEGSMAADAHGAARSEARARLGLAVDEFMVCSFGMLGPTKLNNELVDAFLASPLAADPRCTLVFVGENAAEGYGDAVLKKIRGAGFEARIRITGFVDAATYADYLAACDAAVQLRTDSRGETSASVLDCLLYGVPTIVNAHGAAASIADDLLLKLPDRFAAPELAQQLARLHADAGLRAALSARALAHMEAEHTPAHTGRLYFEAIEHFARHGQHALYRDVVGASARHCPAAGLRGLAAAIAFNRAPAAPRQLLVDVSALIQADLKTGIQRVVRSILLALIADPPPGYRVEPVFNRGASLPLHYARRYGMELVGQTDLVVEDAPAELRPGDIFFGLDLFVTGVAQNRELLLSMRDRGVDIYFCMYDLLPLLRPDVFPFGTEHHFDTYVRTVHEVADGVLCISRAVADEVAGWIGAHGLERRTPLKLGWFHLGADIDASAPSAGLPGDAARVLDALSARPSFLMVGTLEPRKGHAQALAAFDLLWERGVDVNLVIVGKEGWMVEKLVERLKAHPEAARRLFWLPGISDEMLLKLYAGASALLAASEGEGFGLPLIEAAQHGIPIIARSLPVFREVAGEHAYYFEGLAPDDLAAAVGAWLALHDAGKAPASAGMPWLTWDRSARQVVDALVGGNWYRVLPGTGI